MASVIGIFLDHVMPPDFAKNTDKTLFIKQVWILGGILQGKFSGL